MWYVRWSAQQYGSEHMQHSTLEGVYPTKEDALICAEVAASEHAERLQVEYKKAGNPRDGHSGFYFMTNNQSHVWYCAVPTSALR